MGDLAGNLDSLVENLAGGTGVHADDRASNGRLAGAGFADEGEGLALVNIEGGVLDGADGVVALAEGDVHILQGEQPSPAGLVDRTMLGQDGFFLGLAHQSSPPSSML